MQPIKATKAPEVRPVLEGFGRIGTRVLQAATSWDTNAKYMTLNPVQMEHLTNFFGGHKVAVLLWVTTFAFSLALHAFLNRTPKRTEEEVRKLFEEWMVKHKRNYKSLEEKEKRFKIFKHKLRYIDKHNSKNLSWRLGLGPFSDWTNEEYLALSNKNCYDKSKLRRLWSMTSIMF